MNRAFKLYRLQQVDIQLNRKNARLKEIAGILSDDRAVRQAKSTVEIAEQELNESKKSLRRTEENTSAQRRKIQQAETRLYSGKVRNPKELQDLQNESAALKRYLDVLEERQIEAMLVVDEMEAEYRSSQSKLGDIQARRIEEHAALIGEQTRLNQDVERLLTEQEVAKKSLSEDDLRLYNRLCQRRSGIAIAKVTDKSCTACGTSLSSALYQSARSPAKITHCDACGRVLYAS